MKFTYWGGVRSGKFQIWQLFELNGKKTAVFPQSGKKWPAYALIYGNELNHLLYEENGQIKSKHCKSTVFENGVYKNNFQTNGVERHWSNDPQVLYKCFDFVFEQDLIICPYMMLGYYGKLGTKEFNEMVKNRKPNMKVDIDYSVSMLKKRRNVIPYKSDKFYETWIFQKSDPNTKVCVERQKNSWTLRSLTEELLTHYGIPYEMFDIDSDYSFFGLDKPLPKNQLHQNQEINFKLPSNDVIAERCRTILDQLQDNQED